MGNFGVEILTEMGRIFRNTRVIGHMNILNNGTRVEDIQAIGEQVRDPVDIGLGGIKLLQDHSHWCRQTVEGARGEVHLPNVTPAESEVPGGSIPFTQEHDEEVDGYVVPQRTHL